MLILIFVVVTAIIGLVLFSSPPPDKNPAVNLRITNESRLIKIYHTGGDPLLKEKIQIYVDGTLRVFNGFGMDNIWSLGEVLDYTVPVSDPMPNKIDIVYSESPWRGTNSALIATLMIGSQTNVQPDVTVFSITASAGSGGTITPSGSVSVNDGSSQTFTIAQNAGYSILDVVVNGTSQGPIPSYTFTNVRSDQIISATFQLIGPPAPVANFTGTPTSGMRPLMVAFTDTSTDSPTSWLWTFGDGDTTNNTQQNPLHSYANAGTYTVSLTATNAGGSGSLTRTNYITVNLPPAQTIFSDNFETAFSGWTTSGTANWYTGSPRYGTHSIQFRDDGQISRTVSTSGYETMIVSFALAGNSIEGSEAVLAQWSPDGSSWNTMGQITNGVLEDNQLHVFTFSVPAGGNNNPSFALRFILIGTGNDRGYVDNVVLTGIPL